MAIHLVRKRLVVSPSEDELWGKKEVYEGEDTTISAVMGLANPSSITE